MLSMVIRFIDDQAVQPGGAALFLDRDGVLNRRVVGGYVVRESDLELLDAGIEAARVAQDLDIPVVIVTNQGGISRGLLSVSGSCRIHAALIGRLALRNVRVGAIYVCPHHPLATDPEQRSCHCRKPQPGLFTQAAVDLGIALRGSAMIGDQETDRSAAEAAGVPGDRILVVDESARGDVVAAWTRQMFS